MVRKRLKSPMVKFYIRSRGYVPVINMNGPSKGIKTSTYIKWKTATSMGYDLELVEDPFVYDKVAEPELPVQHFDEVADPEPLKPPIIPIEDILNDDKSKDKAPEVKEVKKVVKSAPKKKVKKSKNGMPLQKYYRTKLLKNNNKQQLMDLAILEGVSPDGTKNDIALRLSKLPL